MQKWLARLIIAPLALVLASVGLLASPAAAITGTPRRTSIMSTSG